MKVISLEDAIKAMAELEKADIERFGVKIPEAFDSESAIEALEKLPSYDLMVS